MFYGFFLRTGRIISLLPKSIQLAETPQMCSAKSTLIPHLIGEIPQIIPTNFNLNSFTTKDLFIPFFLILTDGNISQTPTPEFNLIFYPNPQHFPEYLSSTTDETSLTLYKEYWKNIKPMLLCRDVSGYYLGIFQDPYTCKFRVAKEQEAEAWICGVTSSVAENICYININKNTVKISEEKIYLKRVK